MSIRKLLPYFRLFSGRRRLTVQEKESILDALLDAHAASVDVPQTRGWRYFAKAAALAAGLLLVAIPLAVVLTNKNSDSEFAERGDVIRPGFTLKCSDESNSAHCLKGGTLAFVLRAPASLPYFAAFALHEESEKVIWYFPAKSELPSILIESNSRKGVLKESIRIGEEHPVGQYKVFGVFSRKALFRENIRSVFLGDRDSSDDGISIVTNTMTLYHGPISPP